MVHNPKYKRKSLNKMNEKLQDKIRIFIGEDATKAIERVHTQTILAWELLKELAGKPLWILSRYENNFVENYGIVVYGSGLAKIMDLDVEFKVPATLKGLNSFYQIFGQIAVANAETRIAAMLWAAVHIVKKLNDTKNKTDD